MPCSIFFFLLLGFFVLLGIFFVPPPSHACWIKTLFFSFHVLHLILAFGRWERLREPGLFLYVLPLVYGPRSEQAGHCFWFFWGFFVKEQRKEIAAPQVRKFTSCRVSSNVSGGPIGQDSTEPPRFLVDLTVLITNLIFMMQVSATQTCMLMYANNDAPWSSPAGGAGPEAR